MDYFGFRYYDAVLGKFTTRDPSGYPDGPNNYLYCNNNPINCIDPLGLDWRANRKNSGRNKGPRKSDPKAVATATVAVSTVPLVGEAMDVHTLFAKDSSGWDRLGAFSSLLLSVVTVGLTPNYGAIAKADKVLDSAPDAQTLRNAQKVTETPKKSNQISKADNFDDLENFKGYTFKDTPLTKDQISTQVDQIKRLKKKGQKPPSHH